MSFLDQHVTAPLWAWIVAGTLPALAVAWVFAELLQAANLRAHKWRQRACHSRARVRLLERRLLRFPYRAGARRRPSPRVLAEITAALGPAAADLPAAAGGALTASQEGTP